MGGSTEYVDPLKKFPAYQKLIEARQPQVTPDANISKVAQTMRQQLDWNAVVRPTQYKLTTAQVDSSSTGDTVVLTGATNKSYIITYLSAYASGTGNASFRFEIDTGSSFGTTRRISTTDATDKELDGSQMFLKSTDRIVLNVTSAVGSSTIDIVCNYIDAGFGSVYG
jgi:hypothetical protein|tara:strand:+ start:2078 stop:2581 length:504 start_codon:yes stop_codon:yes gene_type:complete